jgi:hypothetical protein
MRSTVDEVGLKHFHALSDWREMGDMKGIAKWLEGPIGH